MPLPRVIEKTPKNRLKWHLRYNGAMRVVMVSKALVVGAYQRKAEALAALGVDLTVLIPPAWADSRGRQQAERTHTNGYTLRTIPIRFNGNFHLHYYPTLPAELAAVQPDILHMDEEPYNFATWHGLAAATRLGIAGTFFTWQNLLRRYPPPFRWLELANYRCAPIAIAGNTEGAAVLRRKGYRGEIAVIPQFGVDPAIFQPATSRSMNRESSVVNGEGAAPYASPIHNSQFTIHNSQLSSSPLAPLSIGYAGGLVPEKGVDLILRACAGLVGDWQLTLAGEGDSRAELERLAVALHIADRMRFAGRIGSDAMPVFYHELDVLVLSSRTRPNWKEQFGRVLVEAMACGVAVVGSDCGEIPQVIGDAGLVFAEDDVVGLREALQRLLDNPQERQRLAAAGRQRVLDQFTMQQIAEQTLLVYRQLVTHAHRA